jgi:HEAT repeat protein
MPPTTDDDPAASIAARRRDAALAGYRGHEAVARLALDDPAPSVRATALGALARAGVIDLDDVTAAMADPAAEVRARAAELAISFGAPAVPLLLDALGDPDDRVVEAGSFALGELGPSGAGAVPGLSAVVHDHRDALCREAAVAALGAIGDPAGLPSILAATTDKPAVRRRAVLALAPFDGPDVEQALQRAAQDRDWQVRQAAEDLGWRETGPAT